MSYEYYANDLANEGFGDFVTNAGIFLRNALNKAAELLLSFFEWAKRHVNNFINGISNRFTMILKKFADRDVEISEQEFADMNNMMNDFDQTMDESATTIMQHSSEYNRDFTIDSTVNMFEEDNADLESNRKKLEGMTNENAASNKTGGKKVKLGTKFFRDVKAHFKLAYSKALASTRRLGNSQKKAAERGIFRGSGSVINRICTAIMNVANTIVAVIKAALNTGSYIITVLSRAIVNKGDVQTRDVRDQGISIDPILIGGV